MAKIVSGLLILRKGKSPDWSSDLDAQMSAWVNPYINWLETAPIALEEGASTKSVTNCFEEKGSKPAL